MDKIFLKLKNYLNNISTGFPGTESGIELEILKKLFTRDDAKLFLSLSPLPESPAEVAERINNDPLDTKKQLEDMAQRGLLFRMSNNTGARYCTPPFTMGILEFQVGRMSKEFAEMTEKYYKSDLGKTLQSNQTILKRTIQVNRRLVQQYPVVPYNDAVQIIEDQKIIAVADCVCRLMGKYNAAGCTKPLETCLSFGTLANYYVDNNAGRFVNEEEAKRILKQSEETGLVVQVSNSQQPASMCACCSCCCIMLKSLRMQPHPGSSSGSNYFAVNNPDQCAGCETCLERCHMGAVDICDGKSVINKELCIGCGLCISTCPTESLKLINKEKDQFYTPPATDFNMYLEILKERGF